MKNNSGPIVAISIKKTTTDPTTITLGDNPIVCIGSTSADLTYDATTNSPDIYSIDFDVAAEAQGFVDVVDAPLPSNPIVIIISGATTGTYNGILTVTNSGTAETSSDYPITVTINPKVNAGTVSGNSSLCIGSTDTYYSDGDGGGSWSSSNTGVATVDPSTGQVSAVSEGTADIIYTINTGCGAPTSSYMTLTVNYNGNAGTISGNSSLCIGSTDYYYSNGDGGGSWSSSNTSVATVDPSSGYVYAVSAGSTDITYSVGCNASSTLTLTVNSNGNAGTISGNSSLCIGSADYYYSNGDGGGSWSSSNTSVATVDASSGYVYAVSAGSTDITYSVGCNASSYLTLTVNSYGNAGTVSGNSNLCAGSSDYYYSNGDGGGSWSSSNTSVATVDASSGYVYAVSAGSADITYTVNGCSGTVSSSLTLTVNSNGNAGTISGNSNLCIGSADYYYSNGDGGGSWSSSNTGVATVDPSTGYVTTMSDGETDITYSVGCNASSFMTLTVNPGVNAGTVTGTSVLCNGSTDFYSSNGDGGGTWSSTDPGVATVDPTTGLVTTTGNGTTDIIYTLNSGCGAPASSFMTLNVNAISGTLASDGSCKNMDAGSGATFSDGSCNTITRIIPNGGSPLTGMVSSCVTVDASIQSFGGEPYLQRHYDIEPSTSPGTATARIILYALQSEFDTYNSNNGIFSDMPTGPSDAAGISNLRITQYHGTGTAPGNYSGSTLLIDPVDADIVWDATNNWWEISFDVTGFSGFYINTGSSALPVSILNFSGYKDGSRNQLRWSTASESNNSGFEVQRSTDGINYTTLVFVNSNAPGGSSTVQLNYAFTDNNVTGNRQYYRLRQVDFDSHSKLSNIVMIKGEKPVTLMIDGLFPNPASTLVNVLIATPSKDKVTLVITDITGRKVIEQVVSVETGSNTIPVDINRLTNGTYMVKLVCSSNCESAVGKFVKQ